MIQSQDKLTAAQIDDLWPVFLCWCQKKKHIIYLGSNLDAIKLWYEWLEYREKV